MFVKVKVAVPGVRAVTIPALVTDATAGLLLTHVPPVEGDKPVISPIHKLLTPTILTIGIGFTVTAAVGNETQPVDVLVNMKVAVPAETPVTTPAFETVATLGFVLTHVPPLDGESVVVAPSQILVEPVMLTIGAALTVTALVAAETQPVVVFVKVKVAIPAATPVTTPAFVTVATDALLLIQVPPLDGESPVVAPTQILFGPLMLTVGNALTVMAPVGEETQPVFKSVNVKVAVPAETPVTTPVLVTVATAGSLLTHVPPVVGDNVVVNPTQTLPGPVILTAGAALTVTAGVGVDVQPVIVFVNVKVAVPAETPVTTPALVTVATDGLLLIQIPLVGESVVVPPIQTLVGPVIFTGVGAFTVTAGVGAEVHPVAVLVNVKVADPAPTPVIIPPLVIVATALLLLAHVPPDVGDTPDISPIQMLDNPVNVTVGIGFTVTVEVGIDAQPVIELVKVNVTVPAETPVTTPALVTVATDGLLLVQVPPEVGDKVVVNPSQMLLDPVMLTTGRALTVMPGVGSEVHPVAVSVKVNVAVPAETPVTTPALVTVAIELLLLAHEPPVVGESVVVAPAQIVLTPVTLTTGNASTVTALVVDEQLGDVLLVKVNVAEPAATAVTTPALVTVATIGSLLVHVPPLVGDNVVVAPAQMVLPPVILTTGRLVTETAVVGIDTQPVVPSVKVNVAIPAAMPVTTPALVTVATDGLLLTHVPPLVGDKVVVNPAQILDAPVTLTTGSGFTVTGVVAEETQPVAPSVNVNVAEPPETPVTTPALVTVATAGLLLVHVPPVEGDKVVVEPAQIVFGPAMFTSGNAFTVNVVVVALQLGNVFLVKVKVTVPALIPVTKPALVTLATVGLLLLHVPPVVGLSVVVAPAQMVVGPVKLTTGSAFTVTVEVAAETHPVAVFVKVNVAVPADTPVTTPEFVTVATPGSLLTHVPPVVGDKVVVPSTQMLLAPVMLTTGNGLTVTLGVGSDGHPFEELVNTKVELPPEIPVTTPALVTLATEGTLLAQVPPDVGESPVTPPTQMVLTPVMLTVGAVTIVMVEVAVEVHPLASPTVTV